MAGLVYAYSTGGVLLVSALSGDLEGDAVGSLGLDLKSGGRSVVEVLVQQLDSRSVCDFIVYVAEWLRLC